ncbi:MAG TPA: hypothetical protein VFN22_14005 [Gemmatimonadales bacterium]|nr:hypothetical protein [Gemmatimonadales bacterium]
MPAPLCLFVYLYRDASNYKGWGFLELRGEASEANEAAIREVLIDGMWFDPERAGIPTVFHLAAGPGGFDPRLDHPLHEFIGLEVPEPNHHGADESDLTIEQFIKRLREARG